MPAHFLKQLPEMQYFKVFFERIKMDRAAGFQQGRARFRKRSCPYGAGITILSKSFLKRAPIEFASPSTISASMLFSPAFFRKRLHAAGLLSSPVILTFFFS